MDYRVVISKPENNSSAIAEIQTLMKIRLDYEGKTYRTGSAAIKYTIKVTTASAKKEIGPATVAVDLDFKEGVEGENSNIYRQNFAIVRGAGLELSVNEADILEHFLFR
jgi:hypothetical protein